MGYNYFTVDISHLYKLRLLYRSIMKESTPFFVWISVFCFLFLLPANFLHAQSSSEEPKPQVKNGKWGYVDRKGRFVIDPTYDWSGDFEDGRAMVSVDSQLVLINSKGTILDRTGWSLKEFLSIQELRKSDWANVQRTASTPAPPAGSSIVSSTFPCPPNIDWELNNYTNWNFFQGSSATSNSTYLLNLQPTTPLNDRHTLFTPAAADTDPWGGFSKKPPNGGQRTFRLGNDYWNYQAEAASYKITIPPTANPDYSLTFQYAVVLQNPISNPHDNHEQPALRVRMYYLNSLTDTVFIPCGSFEFVASLVGVLPGFYVSNQSPSSAPVWCKPWSSVYVNLSKYQGKEVYLEFLTADCALGAHFGYAYIDVSECGVGVQALNRCTSPSSVLLQGPPGFQSYTWYANNNYGSPIGTGQTFTAQNAGPVGSTYQVIVQPYNNINCSSCNCSDTFNVAVPPRVFPPSDAGPDRSFCINSSAGIGSPPTAGLTYSWTPATGLSSSTVSNPTANPTTTTQYVLTTTIPASNCSANDTVVVTVHPKPVVQFTINNVVQCRETNQFVFTNQSAGTGLTYRWRFGDGNESTNANPTYVYQSASTFEVTLIVTNSFGCVDSLKRTVTVYPKPQAQFSIGPNASQCLRGNNFQFSVTNPVGGNQYSWDMGTGLATGQTGTSAQFSYLQPGSYTVYLAVLTPQGCKDTLRLPVQVNPMPAASFTINNPTQCFANNSFTFTNTSQSVPGGIGSAWNFGVAGGQSSQTSPTYSYATPGNYNVQLIVTSPFQCADTTSRPVTIHPTPQVNLFIPQQAQCLMGNAFTFTNQTTILGNTPLTYLWDFGNLTGSIVTSPTYSYPSPGTYTITLVATSNQNCTATATNQVTVHAQPAVQINQRPVVSICSGETVQLTSTATAGSGIITQYQWSLAGQPISGANNNAYTASVAGQYHLLVTNSNGCSRTDSVNVIVNPLPVGSLAIPAQNYICDGQSVTLSASGGVSYNWYLNNNLVPGVNGPTFIATQPGSYSVEVVNSFGCKSRVPVPVVLILYRAPIADFSFTESCVNTPILFTNNSQVNATGPVSYNWSFGDNTTSSAYSPVHAYPTPRSYAVTLTVQSTACTNLRDVKNATIDIVVPAPNVRYPTLNSVINTPLQLQARPIGIAYRWSPPRGLSSTQISNPVYNYDQQQEYLVRIQNQNGCINVDTVLVRVFAQGDIFVPNAFTPNGDGLNDRMYPILVGMMRLNYFRVFNRWGQLVFQTNSSDPANGWDGRVRSKEQGIDTYTWTAEAVDPFGMVIRRNGNFVLIR